MYLGEGYHITADKYQYIVEKHGVYKDGKNIGEEYVTCSSFHPTVYSACKWILVQLERGEILTDRPEDAVTAFNKRVKEVSEWFKTCEDLKLEGE